MRPAAAHNNKLTPMLSISRNISDGVPKIPLPIIVPATIAIPPERDIVGIISSLTIEDFFCDIPVINERSLYNQSQKLMCDLMTPLKLIFSEIILRRDRLRVLQ
eukprot:NODE_257_length_12663_cov_0.723655.p12 type:complete len:104 gc:universal NODE_257_length_12663_cov_0.723655:760-449(-)